MVSVIVSVKVSAISRVKVNVNVSVKVNVTVSCYWLLGIIYLKQCLQSNKSVRKSKIVVPGVDW